jgi:uncharacterized protein (DUF2147 family)
MASKAPRRAEDKNPERASRNSLSDPLTAREEMADLARRLALFILCASLAAASAYARADTITGYWREPGGAVIRIAPCRQRLCVAIVKLPAASRAATDRRNPDPALRNRPLCGLRIGNGFVEVDPQHARGGRLYDPKSGRTYSGRMTAEGNLLHLRGYLGLPIFGRTETWVRASRPRTACASLPDRAFIPAHGARFSAGPFWRASADPRAGAADEPAWTRDAAVTGRRAAARL